MRYHNWYYTIIAWYVYTYIYWRSVTVFLKRHLLALFKIPFKIIGEKDNLKRQSKLQNNNTTICVTLLNIKIIFLVPTWFKFSCRNKLFHTVEKSNKLGRELRPAWDLEETPLDLAGDRFLHFMECLLCWSNYLLKFISRTTGCHMGLSTVCFANWK